VDKLGGNTGSISPSGIFTSDCTVGSVVGCVWLFGFAGVGLTSNLGGLVGVWEALGVVLPITELSEEKVIIDDIVVEVASDEWPMLSSDDV
jgi:hypothetical protein